MPRKAHRLRDVGGLPAGRVGAPVFRQIQLAIDEGMAQRGHVGEKDAHLTVFDLSGEATILWPDAGRVAPAFGKAAFIEHQDGEGRFVRGSRRTAREQAVADTGPQLIAHGVLVPDGCREQALDAIRAGLPGLFSDLPAIFSGHVTQNRLQVAQGMLVDFGAGEVRAEPPMQLT